MSIKKIELILITVIILALLLNFVFLISIGGLLLVVSLATLSMIYFAGGYFLFKPVIRSEEVQSTNVFDVVIAVVAGFIFSISTIGMLFKIQTWEGASWYMTVSLGGLCFLLTLIAFRYSTAKCSNPMILKRLFVYGVIAAFLISLPQFTLLDMKYRKHPAYLNALKRSIENPNDTLLQKQLDQERMKMHAAD